MAENEGAPNGAQSDNDTDSNWSKDLMASLVVFLVALPLCMGIAIASGVPPALGLITGIVGGLVVGFIAGQPLQVSGPAAGLTVMVWQLIQDFGIAALGPAVLIAGIIQLGVGFTGLGRWFRAVAPAVVQGMLAGIGVLIFASQFHVMVDDKPRGGGMANLLSIPEAIYKGIFPLDGSVHHMAAAIGLLTIITLGAWNRFKPESLRMLPAPLMGVLAGVFVSAIFGLPINYVKVPDNLLNSISLPTAEATGLLAQPGFWATAIGLALIASAETLLCATALDRMHSGERTKYDKELRAQGVGNIICGIVGALPMTGVIVRSSANIEAGGQTKWSTIFHGIWILMLVAVFPQVLALIPTASLAAILVNTGWKLLNIPAAKRLLEVGRMEFAIWFTTVFMIVATDLLIGVASGFALALFRLVVTFARLEVDVKDRGDRVYDIDLYGAATFMSLPPLAEALEQIPDNSTVHFHLDSLTYVDHACIELIEDWHERHPGTVHLETVRLRERRQTPKLRTA